MTANKPTKPRNLPPRQENWASALMSLSKAQLDGLRHREALVLAAQDVLSRLGIPATHSTLNAHMPKIAAHVGAYRDGHERRGPGRAAFVVAICSARTLHRWITLYRKHGPIGLVDGRSRVRPGNSGVGGAGRMTLLSDAPQPGRERLTDERKILGTRERIVLEVEFNQNRLISRWRSRDLSGAVQRAGGNTCGWQPMCGGQSAPPGFREPAYGRFLRFRSSD